MCIIAGLYSPFNNARLSDLSRRPISSCYDRRCRFGTMFARIDVSLRGISGTLLEDSLLCPLCNKRLHPTDCLSMLDALWDHGLVCWTRRLPHIAGFGGARQSVFPNARWLYHYMQQSTRHPNIPKQRIWRRMQHCVMVSLILDAMA